MTREDKIAAKHLGIGESIVFTYNEMERLQKIFYDKLKDIRLQIRLWRCRGLSLLGKITIIKSFFKENDKTFEFKKHVSIN